MAADDEFLDKAIEGLVLYAFNKGEVCTCPSRALIQESVYDEFMPRCLERIGQIGQGPPLDNTTQLGPQVRAAQLEKIESYVRRSASTRARAAPSAASPRTLVTSSRAGITPADRLQGARTRCGSFRRRSLFPVVAVTTFKDEAEGVRRDRQRHHCSRPRRGCADSRHERKAFRMGRERPGWPRLDKFVTTNTRPMPRSAATRGRGSGARTTR